MQKKFILVFLACCWLAAAGVARAQTLNQEMSALADKLSKALVAQGYKAVAAVDFTDLQGQPTELGRFLSERLAVEIVSAGGVSMVDRANIKSILAEHKLTEEGLVNPANAKKLGEFAGVDAILIGNVTALDGIELMVKAISTDSAKIVAAGRITFPKTSDIQQLLNRGISANPTANASPTTATPGSGTSYQDANGIATKDIGALRVLLRSVMPMKLKDTRGASVAGIRLSFELMNRDTQRPVVVALNAEAERVRDTNCAGTDACELLRSSLLDERGNVWKLFGRGLAGLATVRVGEQGYAGLRRYPATDIVKLLDMRDKLGSDQDPSDPYGKGVGGNKFIFGSATTLAPGQTVRITMDFVLDDMKGPAAKAFQINSEMVVGFVAPDSKVSYTLQNLTLDRVIMPVF